jgi:DNA-directed RNA polymerase specialized sigma24 family protein
MSGFVEWIAAEADSYVQEEFLDRDPDLWLYRDRTVGLLRRYLRFSLETGRLPSLVGREFFRAKITSYTATTFEDRVIFVRDVEKCLNRLDHWDQQLVARVILQEHSQGQAAHILHCCRKTVQRRLPVVLDMLSEDFLRVGLLVALPSSDEAKQ